MIKVNTFYSFHQFLLGAFLFIFFPYQIAAQSQKLVSPIRAAQDQFGNSVSVSGDYAVVAADWDDEDENELNSIIETGSVYVYKYINQEWIQMQKLVASDRARDDHFGFDVSILNDLIIVGAYLEDDDESGMNRYRDAGSAYIFRRNSNDQWIQIQKLVASDRAKYDRFGESVAISEDYAIVGAAAEDHDANGINKLNEAGSVYIYERNSNDQWIEVQKIVASDRAEGNAFGKRVAISLENEVVVSSPYTKMNGILVGSVYFYRRNSSGQWIEAQKIINPNENNNFGFAISIEENYVTVGAWSEDNDETDMNPLSAAGSSYMYERDDAGYWMFIQKLVASDRSASANFGYATSISGKYIVVSAYEDDFDANGTDYTQNAGSIYVFERQEDGQWIEIEKMVAFDRAIQDRFGSSVSISEGRIMVGAPYEDENAQGTDYLISSGSAYFYELQLADFSCTENLVINDAPIIPNTYQAANTIESKGTVNDNSGEEVIFKAGNIVRLNPGFTVVSGAKFSAQIADCSATNSMNSSEVVEIRSDEVDGKSSISFKKTIIEVYPNPANDFIHYYLENFDATDVNSIALYNIQGQLILESEQVNQRGSFFIQALPEGVYLFVVKTRTRQHQKIFIKN